MKLGVYTVLFRDRSLKDVLEAISQMGITAVEIPTGGYSGTAHADPDILLSDKRELEAFADCIKRYGMEISALNCSGNPLHPVRELAEQFHRTFEKTVLFAEKLGIKRVITFSGCPGDSENSRHPNWVSCPWPDEYLKLLEYQWDELLIPYWEKAARFANEHGVDKICLEMHPGFCVYNPKTLLRLRAAVGRTIGANFDPSHLFWQGIEPAAAIRELGDAVFHFHAKDTRINYRNVSVNGVLDTGHYGSELKRSWIFRTVGYGHDYMLWKDIISNLRMTGYNYVLSIEHEDSLMSVKEGLDKSVDFLKQVMPFEGAAKMWWA